MDAVFRGLRRVVRLGCCAGLSGLIAAGAAAEVAQCTTYKMTLRGGEPDQAFSFSGASESEVCSQAASSSAFNYTRMSGGVTNTYTGTMESVSAGVCYIHKRVSWSGGGFAPGSSDQGVASYSIIKETKPCPQDDCAAKAGKSEVINFTVGWTRTEFPDSGSVEWVGPHGMPQVGGTTCQGGCQATIGNPVSAWSSTSPGPTGLYRASVDSVVTYGSSSCTQSPSAPNSPNAAPQACDGFQGSVNGKAACVAPVGAAAASAPAGDAMQGNPAAGSDGGKVIGDPTRTPSNGVGDNKGGPPGANDGAKSGTGGGSGGGGSGGGTGTGAAGGGSASTGTNGVNKDGGTCAANPSAAGCGGAAAGQPDLYQKKTKTMGDVLGAFKSQMQSGPMGQAVGGFFSVSVGGGSCPVWQMPVNYFNTTATLDVLCTSAFQTFLAALRVVLLIVASWAAFRIALY